VGAFDVPYRFGLRAAADDPIGYAILAIKAELLRQGYKGGVRAGRIHPPTGQPVATINPDTTLFGTATDKAVRLFQGDHALLVDGIVGPITARTLFRDRKVDAEHAYGIPDHLLCKMATLESANDPGATGTDNPADTGIMQINTKLNPVTVVQACSPSYAVPYAATWMKAFYDLHADWDAACASWHVGQGGAADWLNARKPATGGPVWLPDLYRQATTYVKLVKGAEW
jgi:hypothetical protein